MTEIVDQTTVFERALQSWEEIGLPELQKDLDNEALEIKENQKNLLVSRKSLATKTKQFKKLEDSQKLEEFKSLLKAYQNEIDNITQKNKYVEQCFFKIYQKISEAPDPKPLLSSSMSSFKSFDETAKLKEQLKTIQEKLDKQKDYEQVKAKLIESEAKHAESLNIKLLLKDDEYKSKIDELESANKLNEMKFERQITQLTKKVAELKALNKISKKKLQNQTKFLNEDEDDEADEDEENDDNVEKESKTVDDGTKDVPNNVSSAAELDLVNRELQFTKQKVFELEKRNKELKSSLDQFEQVKKVEEQLERLEKSNSILLQKSNKESKVNQELQEKLKKIEQDKKELAEKFKNLKEATADYEEIKNELSVLKTMEFDSDVDELIARNRKLNNELVEFRTKTLKLQEQLQQTQSRLLKRELELESLKNTNEKLEKDISNTVNDWENMSMISGMTSSKFGDEMSLASGSGGGSGAEPSLLPIITQQRDRFKQRNSELETKVRDLTRNLNDLKRQNTSLTSKLNKLSTEMRYLQSQAASGGDSGKKSRHGVASNPYGEEFSSSTYDVLLDDYESDNAVLRSMSKYLGSSNVRKVDKKLNQIEKFFYGFLKIVVQNDTSRMLFILYCFLVHLVAFGLLIEFFTGGSSPASSLVPVSTKSTKSTPIDEIEQLAKIANPANAAGVALNAGNPVDKVKIE